MIPSSGKLLETAVSAASAGADYALRHTGRRRETIQTDKHDVKLALDVECQREVEKAIRSVYPDHAILGEEDYTLLNGQRIKSGRPSGSQTDSETLEWIVDPIDGTVNYSHGLPVWCCSVAVRQGARVLAGAVSAPMLNALYAATADGPATCNGKMIHVSDTRTLERSIVMTSMDRVYDPGIPPLTCMGRIAAASRKARIAGAAAVDLCWVAQGAAEGYFEASIYLWDIAAAGLIVERAGGKTEVIALRDQPHQMSFLASNGYIHDQLKKILPPLTGRNA